MKTFLVIVFGCVCIVQNYLVQAQETDPPSTDPPTTTPGSPVYCEEASLSCYDCHTLQYCSKIGDAEPLFNVSCKVQNANLPYCDKNKNQCVAENVCEPEETESQECYNNGTRPDPTDCSQYIQCISDGNNKFIGTIVKCPERTLYNAAQGKCVTSTQCLTIDRYCNSANAGRLIRYTPYPAIYAKCPAANSNEKIIVKLCKGEYVFNQQTAVCEPVCKQEGYIANNLNCHAYYYCARTSNGGYSISSNLCPSKYGFNPVTKSCDSKLANCEAVGRSLQLRRKRDLLESLTFSIY